jgi:hypothetical protein
VSGVFHNHIAFKANIEWEAWEFVFGIHEHCSISVHIFDGNWPYTAFTSTSSGKAGLSSCMNPTAWKRVKRSFDASNILLDFLMCLSSLLLPFVVDAFLGGSFVLDASVCQFGVLGCEG